MIPNLRSPNILSGLLSVTLNVEHTILYGIAASLDLPKRTFPEKSGTARLTRSIRNYHDSIWIGLFAP